MPAHTKMKILLFEGFLLLYLSTLSFASSSLEPGFLDFDNLPDTNFSCYGKVVGGYYADLETSCQMFHVCTYGPMEEAMDIRFLCLNGTVFDQETRVCERIDEVDCSKSEKFYDLNLKLYGDTLPPILKEPEKPKITVSSTTKKVPSSTPRPYSYSSPKPSLSATTHNQPKVITTHHFPVSNSADIRFNPEEINISLKPGARPDIRPNPISYQQNSNYNTNGDKSKRVIVTTHTTVYKTERKDEPRERENKPVSTAKPISIESYHKNHHGSSNQNPTPTEINYEFAYQDTESPDYQTETAYQYHEPQPQAQYHKEVTNYQSTTYRTSQLSPISSRRPTTYRSPPISSSTIKISQPYQYHSTEKPSRLQLPLPLLPTLPPLIFSSPAPFSTRRHEESKRYTDPHVPRIVISASASVSDASGRKLNYTFGPLETSQIFDSYEDYKEDDEGVESFYHDVPKLKKSRRKRSTADTKAKDIIKNEEEAINVLKFLFDWYSNQEKTTKLSIPLKPELITEINDELTLPLDQPTTATSSEETTNESTNNNETDNKNYTSNSSKPSDDVSNNVTVNERSDYDYEYQDDIKKDSTENSGKEYNKKLSNSDKPRKDIDVYDYVDDNYEIDLHKERLKNRTLLEHGEIDKNETKSEEVKEQSEQSNENKKEFDAYTDYVDDNYESELHNQRVAKNKTSMFDYDVDYVDDNYESQLYQEQMLLKRLYDITSGEVRESKNLTHHTIESEEITKNATLEEVTVELNETAFSKSEEDKEDYLKEVDLTTTPTPVQELLNSVEDFEQTSKDFESPTTQLYTNTEKAESDVTTTENIITTTPEPSKEIFALNNFNESAELKPVNVNKVLTEDDQHNKTVKSGHKEHKKQKSGRERNFRSRGKKRFELNGESNSGQVTRNHRSRWSSTKRPTTTTSTTTTTTTPTTPTESIEIFTTNNDDEEIETTTNSDIVIDTVTADEALYSHQQLLHNKNKNDETVLQESEQLKHDVDQTPDSVNDSAVVDILNNAEITTTTPFTNDLFDFVKDIETTTKSVAFFNVPSMQPDTTPSTIELHPLTTEETAIPTLGHSSLLETIAVETSTIGMEASKVGATTIETFTRETFALGTSAIEPSAIGISTTEIPPIGSSIIRASNFETSTTGELMETSLPEYIPITTTPSTISTIEEHQTSLVSTAETVITPSYNKEFSTTQAPSSQIPDSYISTTTKSADHLPITTRNDYYEQEPTATTTTNYDSTINLVTTTSTSNNNMSSSVLTTVEPNIDEAVATTINDIIDTTTPNVVTTVSSTTARSRRTRPPHRRDRNQSRKPKIPSHRFSQNRRNFDRRKPVLEETITMLPLTTGIPIIDSLQNKIKVKEKAEEENKINEEVPLTEAPLSKSANPTLAKDNKKMLTTTPLSKLVRIQLRKEKVNKHFIFNCFDKQINQFYSDPRDCRLFHYCTPGYTKNQLLDMKFVCDFGTYFDDERLICTKTKPSRCT